MTLSIHQLVAARNEQALFSPVQYTLQPQGLLQITGVNGSGKSTFLRVLAGLLTPLTGSVCGIHSMHYLGHANSLKPELTVWENIQLSALLLGSRASPNTLNTLLTEIGLHALADHPTRELSAGQARRLALIRLLLIPADVWLLDEPTTALDAEGKAWLDARMNQHRAAGGMVVMATHEPVTNPTHTVTLTTEKKSPNTQQLLTNPPTKDQASPNLETQRPFALFFALLKSDLLQTVRNGAAWLTPLLFFTMAIVLFPLSIGPDTRLLHAMAPAIVWVVALLSILLSIDNLFRPDKQEGWLDLLLTRHCPLLLPVFAKIMAHWLCYGLPLVLLSPLFGATLGLNAAELHALFLSLLIGTPILSLTGAMGAAVVAGIRGQALLLPVLILPLYIPVLIFGTGCVSASGLGQPIAAQLALLSALLLFTLTFAPLLAGVGLRSGVS